ncbi:MAG: permease-like cell division protein FtsX [Bacteroidales bacterium]|nr:permease-like cell division protein FtsX [Bacteroidales bacterium]
MNQEELFNRRRLRSSYASVIISISLMLYLSGLFLFMVINTNKLIEKLTENIGITVVLKEGVKEGDLNFFLKKLHLRPYTKEIIYTSKEQAAAEMTEDLGESFIDFIGYNPLPSSFELKVLSDYSNRDSLAVITKELTAYNFVYSVSAQYDMVDNLNKTKTRVSVIMLSLNVFLLILIVVIINNTIKLAVYANRYLIKTMQMIGATCSFIRKPYLVRGLMQGFVGATFAVLFLSLTIFAVVSHYPDVEILLSLSQYVLVLLFVYALGILVSFFTSLFAVNKYLKIRTKILY